MSTIYEWNKLVGSAILNNIKKEWKALLGNKNLKEADYHAFLKKHPALFLCIYGSYLVLSKVKLGGEFETDFVVVQEGYSDGTIYELIEIESPHTTLFDKKGVPTAKLNSSLQQIRDWRRFLIDNKSLFQKVFPTSTTSVIKNSKLKFKIIIGRRENDSGVLAKREQICEENNIEIMSFDRLTDILESRIRFPETAAIHAGQMLSVPLQLKNELANPFFMCISDSQWRKICNKGHHHIYSNMLDEILGCREYNEHFNEFKKLYY